MQAAVLHQNQLKALEASMAALNKTQQALSHQAAHQVADHQSAGLSAAAPSNTSENSIFFRGIQDFRKQLDLHDQSGPIFVVSHLLRDMNIYSMLE
jgi:hypothetical protein